MSDISRELVKCAKCGKESQQLIVYSVNYALGSEESNDKLTSHKQKCPYCNYEAISIDVLNNKLTREELEKITNQFIGEINKYEIFKIPNELYLDYFNQLKEIFNKYEFQEDDRFVTYCRLDFLRQELTDRLHDDKLKNEDPNWKDKWDNRLGAFWDLADYIRGDRHITPSSVPNGESFKDILVANDQYYKDGFICKQERDILLEMINEMETFVKSKKESSEYDMTNSSKKLILKIEDNDWGLKTIYTWNTKTWCIYDDLSVEYEIRNGENKTKSYSHNISNDVLKQIIENIELAKSENCEVQACDGEAWNFIQYENDNVVWERKLGYIYGIEPLENVCDILINLVRNDSDVFIEDEKEENNMGLFNKKNKYDVNAEDNLPQFVYGIPDSMRKQWEKEKEEKRKNQKTIFSAFEGGYFGPSYYYFINNYKDSYEFRVGYSKDGRFVQNDENDPNIHIFEQNKEHYNKFMEELLSEIKDWNETYNDPGVMDGTQWNIELIEQNKKYSGSNAFPQNYDKVVAILKKYFNVDYFIKDNEKYDIKPEDNVPYEVYGIPDFKKKNYDVKPEENVPQRVYGVPNAMLNNNDSKYDIKPENNVPQRVYGVPNTNIPKPSNNSVIKKSVGVGIKNEKSNYVLSINYAEKLGTYDLLFADLNNLENKSISDLATPVPEKYYTDFITKLYSIINDWENNYSGDSNVSWNIKIDDENNQKTISGKGGFPKNWNKLIDLLSEYERLFKVSKDIELGKIQDMKDAKLSFEEVVRNKVSDPFWVETIVKHFKEEEKMNDVVSKILFKDLSKYDDILNEFTKYLTQRTYDIDGAIEINGYTAKKVAELNPAFHATGVYTFMELLRDDFAKAEEIIKGGFKNKDVVPPTIKKDSNSEEEMLKEIEDEVDKEMIELGLLTIKDGRKIPAFGSCHTRWGIEKRILKERYNYDYKTPAEKNPFINFD